LATWSFIVYRVVSRPARAHSIYVCVPARRVTAFRMALGAGRLDELFARALMAGPGDRVLCSTAQTDEIGLFDRVDDPLGLLPPERHPATGLPFDGGGGGGRQAKERSATPTPSPPVRRPKTARRLVALGAVLALVGVAATTATALVVVNRPSSAQDRRVAIPPVSTTIPTSTTTLPTSTTATTPPTTLPSVPFRPTAAQVRTVQLTGTFDVVLRVIASNNGTAPVGTVQREIWQVSATCAGPPCLYTVGSKDPATAAPTGVFPLLFDGAAFIIDQKSVGDCFDSSTFKITVKGGADTTFRGALNVTEAQWRQGMLVPTKLDGTAVLSGQTNAVGQANGCANAENRPITYSIEATRKP
jgi:hypothetical protein